MPAETGLELVVNDWTNPGPESRHKVLTVSPFREDHASLRSILSQSIDPEIHEVGTCREALAFLGRHRTSLIICESGLPDGDWKVILNGIAALLDPPCLIVTSRLADDHLWSEVLNLGGYDVLAKPFDREEVSRVTALATMHWSREAERRLPGPPLKKPTDREPIARTHAATAA